MSLVTLLRYQRRHAAGGGGEPPDETAPDAPTGVTATADADSILVAWDAHPEPFVTFNVYREGVQINGAAVTTTSYDDLTAEPGITYTYTVTAVDLSDNESVPSASDTATIADTTAPAAPTGLVATADADSIVLVWNSNTEPDLSHYNVYRDAVRINVAPVVVASYDDQTAALDTSYTYTVTAVDTSDNESAASTSDTAMIESGVAAPDAPANLTATQTEDGATYSWDAVVDADSYSVYAADDIDDPFALIASGLTATTYDDPNVTHTAYRFVTVRAVNAGGESVDSDMIAVHALNASGTSETDVLLETIGTGADDGYVVPALSIFNNSDTSMHFGKRNGNLRSNFIRVPAPAGITDQHLSFVAAESNPTAITIRIHAYKAVNPAAPTNFAGAATQRANLTTAYVEWTPAAWTNGTTHEQTINLAPLYAELEAFDPATVGDGKWAVLWFEPVDPGGGVSNAYRVANTVDHATLAGPTIHTTTSGGVVDDLAPPAITDLAAGITGADDVLLSWSAVLAVDADEIDIYRRESGGVYSTPLATIPATDTSYTDTTPSLATTYQYKLIVRDATGNASADSNEVTIPVPGVDSTTLQAGALELEPSSDSIGLTLVYSGDDNRFGSLGQTFATVATTAAAGATSLPIRTLQTPIASGTTLSFYNPGAKTHVRATLSADAEPGDTTLTVTALAARIEAGAETVLTAPWHVHTTGASATTTSIPVNWLPIALVAGTQLLFYDPAGQAVYPVVLDAEAAASDTATTLSVPALTDTIPAGSFALVTGIQFKRQADSTWRFALHGWPWDDGTTRAFGGAILRCDANTTYDIRVSVRNSEGVVGSGITHPIVTTATTREDAIATPASAVPTHYVDAATGNDANDGSSGSPWATLDKAVQVANAAAADTAMVVQVAAGSNAPFETVYDPVNAGVSLWLIADNIAVSATQTSRTAQNAGSRTVIEPQVTAAPGDGQITLVSQSGVVNTGTTYPVYTWTNAAVPPPTGTNGLVLLVSDAPATAGTDEPELVPFWAANTTTGPGGYTMATPQGWAEVLYVNESYRYGCRAFANGDNADISFRVPGDIDPRTKHVSVHHAGGINSSVGKMVVNGPNFRMTGFDIRAVPIQFTSGATDGIIDHNLIYAANIQTMGDDTNPHVATSYPRRLTIQYNLELGAPGRIWSETPETDRPVSWRWVKQFMRLGGADVGAWRRIGSYLEMSAVGGSGGGRGVVYRYNTARQYFNGIGSNCQDFERSRFAKSEYDVYGNNFAEIADDVIEPDEAGANWRVWDNRIAHTPIYLSIGPLFRGPVDYWGNRIWMHGNHGVGAEVTGNAGVGPIGVKYAGDNTLPGQVRFVNNTVWSNQTQRRTVSGGEKAAGGVAENEYQWLRNNIYRLTRHGWSMHNPGRWDEDYNHFYTSDGSKGIELKGTSYASLAAYRAAIGMSGTHTNTVSDFHTSIDAEFVDAAGGDLSLAPGSAFIGRGMPVPNVADDGTTPDLGADQS